MVPLVALLVVLCGSLFAADYPVPEPRPAHTDIQVGAYVFPGWSAGRGDSYGEWKLIAKFAHPRPILGFYDDSLPEVANWHINWALEAGISWFAFDWYWNSGEKHLHEALESGFLNARYNEQMKFAIHWCNHDVGGWAPVDNSAAGIETMLRYCADNYFTRSNYLKIGDRPVFMIWNIDTVLAANGGPQGFKTDLLPRLNAICHDKGLGDLFVVLVHNAPERVRDTPVGDAFTGYSYAALTTQTVFSRPGSAPYSELVEALPDHWRRLHSGPKPFITSTQSGWDDLPRTLGWGNDTRWARTDNTAELFEQTLRDGRAQVKPDLPLFIIEAWNEWGEGSFIEPSKEFGFGHLDAIRRVFAPDAGPNDWARPTPEQVDSYSILRGETLAAARARELQPDPAPTVVERKMDLTADPETLPGEVVAEWRFDNEETAQAIQPRMHVEFQGIRDGRAVFKINGGDPQMWFEGGWPQAGNKVAVAFRVRSPQANWRWAELFWAGEGQTFVGERGHKHDWKADGEPHTYVLTFRPGHEPQGFLKAFRIDPPWGTDYEIELEWIKVLRLGE